VRGRGRGQGQRRLQWLERGLFIVFEQVHEQLHRGKAERQLVSRIYRHDGLYYSAGPRTSYGGGEHRGPRYYNNRVVATSAVTVAAIWAESYGRYNFYDREDFCSMKGYFRFGENCKMCSTAVCADGQYRVQCGGGSDGYCAPCYNGCGLFNTDQEASTDSEPRFGVCLQEGSICYPDQSPDKCAYTSEGEPGKAVSNCQIESCCSSCENDDEAKAKGNGTVCRGSTAGLENADEEAILRFDGELPMSATDFNAKGFEYLGAIMSVAGARASIAWVDEGDPVDVIPYMPANSTIWGSVQGRSCLVGFEVSTVARCQVNTCPRPD